MAGKLIRSKAPEILLSGPAGTGKSVACLLKLHGAALSYPNSRHLILRKTRVSLTDTALVTFESRVLHPDDPLHAGAHRANRHSYVYPNKSEIVLGGMDKASRIMSSDYDLIYVQESIELAEEEWEALTTRLRNNRLPYQQLLADTNPERPTHWLKRRCDVGKTVLLESRHEDNPLLYARGAWTPFGLNYLSKLDALTGPRKLRLRHGRWVQAEGVVYPEWDPSIHLVDRFQIPDSWPRLLSVDFGYSNPFVCQFWAVDTDNRLFRYREIYHTRKLVEDHARRIVELMANEPAPVAIICDHADAEGRATLERHIGIPTAPASKDIENGIQSVKARLRKAGDSRARLYLLRDSLDARDPELIDAKRPCCTEDEFDAYIMDARPGFAEKPVDRDNHAMDALRYMVHTLDCGAGGSGNDRETVYR